MRKEGYYGLLERYVFWSRSWGRACFNASQKAALQLMAMQPDKAPQETAPEQNDIELDPEITEASEVLRGLSADF